MKTLVCTIVFLTLAGCSAVPKHQKGGWSNQSFPLTPIDVATTPLPVPPMQSMSQPENPEGVSSQLLSRTITTTKPDGSVVTTVEKAETVVGGSQNMAEIVKEAVGADRLKALLVSFIMLAVAFYLRNEWKFVAGILTIGAAVVAVFGLAFAGWFGSAGIAIFVTYHIVKAQNPANILS